MMNLNLKISQYALQKAEKYAEVVYRLNHSECYGWLLTPRTSRDFIVRDVIFANDQEASHAYVKVSGEGVILSSQEALEKGYRMMGWWHSHSNFKPRQSSIDKGNTLDVLNVLSLTNYYETVKERKIFDDNIETMVEKEGILLKNKNKKESISLEINGNFFIDKGSRIRTVKILTQQRIGFCYSLTVNAKRSKPSAQIALQYQNTEDLETKLIDTELEIIDSDDLIKEEVKRKLKNER